MWVLISTSKILTLGCMYHNKQVINIMELMTKYEQKDTNKGVKP